jgi:serine/threonine protein kinase
VTSSISNNNCNFSKLIGLDEDSFAQITDYVIENKHIWHKKLKKNKDDSIYIRRCEDALPFSLEFWRDGEWMVHTQEIIDRGDNKKITISVNPEHQRIFARIRPLRFDCELRSSIVEEAEKIAVFQGKEGVIQNHRTSVYKRRASNEWNFAMFQDLYSGSLNNLLTRTMTQEELHLITMDLLRGLAAIHEKGFLHEDLKPANILVQIDSQTGLIVKAVLCDLGCAAQIQNSCPHLSDELINWQRSEVTRLLEIISTLYSDREMQVPPLIEELIGDPDLRVSKEQGLRPRPAATAKEALLALQMQHLDQQNSN